jgi:WD40 repeat protein
MRVRNEALATLARIEPEFIASKAPKANPRHELNVIHPDFRTVASVEGETNLVLRSIEDGALRGRFFSPDGPITRVESFSPDGLFLALRHLDALTVWDLRSGQQCLSFPGSNLTFAFHTREDAVVIQNEPYNLVWIDLPSGTERFRWTAPLPRLYGGRAGWQILSFSPDGRLLAGAAAGTRLLEFIEPHTGVQLRLFTNSSQTVAMAWKSSGNVLSVATADGKVAIWNHRTGGLQWKSPAMIAPAYSLAFHPYRDWLAAGCGDGKVRFIDTHQQRFILEYPAENRRISFSPNGVRLGPMWSRDRLGWLETPRAEAFIEFGVGSLKHLTDGSFSPDGSLLAVGDPDIAIFCLPGLGRGIGTMTRWRISSCAFHPGRNELIASDAKGISRYTYDVASTRLSLSPLELIHPGPKWNAIAFTTDGQRFAAYNGQSNAVFVFDQTLTNQLASFGPHPEVETLALSADGNWAATGSSHDHSIQIWNVSSGKIEARISAGFQPRSAFSSDGRWLIINGDRSQLLHTGTWKHAPALPFRDEHPILGAGAFSPDSRILALVLNRSEVHLFDLYTFKPLGILRPPGAIQMLSLVYSSDGSQLAGVGAESRVAVWNMRALERSLTEFDLGWDSERNESATR